MAFEAFTGGRIITKDPRVTILKQGNFNFNCGTMDILEGKNITHMQLLYDKETSRIAFKSCSKETPGAYELRIIKGIGQVSGTAFLKHHGIFSGTTRSFPAVWQDGLLIISLN